MAFIFGGNTPWTYEQLQRKRAVADSLLGSMGEPKNVGEGLAAIGKALAYRGIEKRAGKEEARMRGEFDAKWGALLGGTSGGGAPGMAAPQGGYPGPSGPPLPPPDPNSPHALGDAAMAALGKPAVKTAADPASIKAGLVARGLPEHIAEGFVMNMQDESGLNPGINEANPVVPGSRGGFGLYQLTGPRRKAYEAYAAQRGVPLDDVDAQLDFMMSELQGPEAAAWEKISRTQNAGEAGAAIVNNFLRPASEHAASRTADYLGSQGAPQGGMDIGALVGLASDPMASPAQKAVVEALIQQQLQAADPLRAIEMQKAQLELAQLQNPTDAPPEDFTARMFTLNALGIDPQSEEGKSYIMTGELPEPPKPTDQPNSVQEYEYYKRGAIERGEVPMPYEQFIVADEKAGNPAASNFAQPVTPGQEFVDKAYAPEYVEWTQGGGADMASQIATVESIADRLESGTENLSGPGVGAQPDWLGTWLTPDAVSAREDVESVVQRNLRILLGAQFTQAEGDRLIARAYNPKLPEAENAKRLRRLTVAMKAAAEARQSQAEYYNQNGTLTGWQGKVYSPDDFAAALEGKDVPLSGAKPANDADADLMRKYGIEP